MIYLTIEQIAEKWGISRRSVRQYIDQDRIDGILRAGNRILIPEDAEKPADMRKKENADKGTVHSFNPLALTVASFKPGHAEEYIQSLPVQGRKIAYAELCYLRGDVEKAMDYCRNIGDDAELDARMGSILINVLSTLLISNTGLFLDNFRFLQNVAELAVTIPEYSKMGGFFNLYMNIMIHNSSALKFPGVDVNAFDVPQNLKPMAINAYARYLIADGCTDRAIGMCESVLILTEKVCPVSSVYLALTIAEGYVIDGVWNKAEYYVNYAWSLAQPDKLYTPFAEFRNGLSGLLEKCIKKDYPNDCKKIIELANRYYSNLISIHNAVTGAAVTDKLTNSEFNVAIQAARGFSNDEIAENLDISVNSVRSHLRNIYNKLGVASRKELTKYVLF